MHEHAATYREKNSHRCRYAIPPIAKRIATVAATRYHIFGGVFKRKITPLRCLSSGISGCIFVCPRLFTKAVISSAMSCGISWSDVCASNRKSCLSSCKSSGTSSRRKKSASSLSSSPRLCLAASLGRMSVQAIGRVACLLATLPAHPHDGRNQPAAFLLLVSFAPRRNERVTI